MKAFVSGWYVIYTRPRYEKKVVERLSLESIEFYFPTYKTLRKWADRKKMIVVPLFPSYVFVHLNGLQDYYAGLGAEGALQYVRFGKEIARVDDITIRNLKILEDKGHEMEMSVNTFTPSQVLVIKEGPLSGLSCEVVRYKDKEKILVRVNLLNRCILVDLEVNHLIGA